MKIRSLSLIALLAAASIARAETPLPKDPNNVYGKFDNGMQYVIRHNANPAGRVNVYLHVKTGALNESDTQNGLAHFTEHMAFNGSTHFPPGKLVPLLNSLGMTFGADTNAHTNLWETVYKLNLPNTKPETLDLGMQIFSDYAAGLTLTIEEINEERGIILEEFRTREGVGKRTHDKIKKDLYAGTRLEKHDIIGDAEQIKTFPQAEFQKYYDQWYRPENMTLIVVGDIKPEEVLPAAKKWLAGLSSRTPAKPPQTAGLKPTTRPQAFVYTDREQVAGDVSLTTMLPGRPFVTTVEQYRQDILRDLGSAMVNRRLRNLVATGKAPFRGAEVDTGTFLDEVAMSDAQASGEPADWKPMLTALVTEVDRAVEHGFSDAELKLVERGQLAAAEQAVRTESTADSVSVVNAIARDIGMSLPMLSAQQELDLLKQSLATITADDVTKAFRQSFGVKNFSYIIELPAEKPGLAIPKPEDVLAVADAAWSATTTAPTDAATGSDLLAAQPAAGAVEKSQLDADLKITDVTFANGVVMHHKYSDYKKDTVLVNVTLPGGQLEEAGDTLGMSDFVGDMLNSDGKLATSRFTSTQLADLLTGKNVRLAGDIGRDTLTLQLAASKTDLATGMQLLYAAMTDAKVEDSYVDEQKKQMLQALVAAEKQPQAQLRKAVAQTVLGDDPRFRMPTPELINRVTRDGAQAWLDHILKNAAIEVAVVGDISAEDATALVAQYVGSLPKRAKGFDALNDLRKITRAKGPYSATVTFDSVTPKAIGFGGFISNEELSPDRRPLVLAGDILTNRMIDRIREKEQLVYGISAGNSPARGLPGTGMFQAASMTDPKNGEKLVAIIDEMFADFAKGGPTDQELATAKKQAITEITTSMKDPKFWLNQMSELTYRGRPLADLKSLPGIFETFSKQDIQNAFAKYYTPESKVSFVVTPKSATPPAPATKPTE
ncbi:MAG: pitrilysin family protein [Tepidisphaeraceae bacterium]